MPPPLAPDEDLLRQLPLPLAQLYRRAQNAKTPLEQHLTAFYLWEAGIKLLGAAAVAEYAARGLNEPEIDKRLPNLALPVLGHWWACGRVLLPVLAPKDEGFHKLRGLLFGSPRDDLPLAAFLTELLTEEEKGRRGLRASIRLAELFPQLIAYRNREIGHGAGAQRAAGYHERMAPALFGAFTEVFQLLDPLAGRELAFVPRGRNSDAEGATPGYYQLIGERPKQVTAPAEESGGAQGCLVPGLLYLLGEDRSPVALSPLLGYDPQGNETFFLNGVRAPTCVEYLSYTSGQLLDHSLHKVERSLVRRILSLPEAVEDPTPVPTPGPDPELGPTMVVGNPSPDLVDRENNIPKRIGEYVLEEVIGRGGMGIVYRAWQPSLGRRVAVKVMRRFGDDRRAEWFRREMQVLSRVDHPNLVRVYASGEERDCLYCVMEFLEGEAIHKVAERWRRQDGWRSFKSREYVDRVVRLIRPVVEALSALHNVAVLHSDPKPSNIIVTPDASRAVLIDPLVPPLDIADLRTETDWAMVGTPAYMSPEALSGVRPDSRSDLYSIGVVLWELLAGRPRLEFSGPVLQILQQISQRGPDRIRPHNPDVPPDLEAIVLKCLEFTPDHRYISARELADDLGRWVKGEPVHARPISTLRRAAQLLRQNPWPAATALLGALAAALLLMMIASPSESPSGSAGWLVAAALAAVIVLQWVVLFRRQKARPAARFPAQAAPPEQAAPAVASSLAPAQTEAPEPAPETAREPAATARPRPVCPEDEAFSSQTVVLRYPAPVAIAYRRFCARSQPRDRLAQLFDTFEITLKYLVYLGLSDLLHCRLRAGPPLKPLPKHQGFDLTRRPTRMTLGRWVRSLLDVADELASQPNRLVRELPEVCGTKGFLEREIFGWIKDNRDAATHRKGGLSLHSEKCVPLLREARPRLEKLLQEIAFLRRYPLGFVTAGYPGAGDRSRYRVHSCMGARVASGDEVYPMEAKLHLPAGVPFVVAPDESAVLCLWPFLLQRESDTTQRPSLYVFEEIDEGRSHLTRVHAAAIDHEDVWLSELRPTDADDHGWLFEALGRLPQSVAITPALRLAEGLAESLVGRLTGESLGEHKQYRLVGPIARGGFGTVYDAVDVRTNARVAVKVLEDHEGLEAKGDLAQLKRFQREYEKLQSAGREFSGIVRCFEWGIDILGRREYPWFSMEFAEGGDLNGRLQERRAGLAGAVAWERPELRAAATDEFAAIAEAVAHLHDLNIIHRDIKPANVLILDGGQLRLSDFGLVKELDRPRAGVSLGPGSTRGAVLGTRDYMAPEQERGDALTKAADVYSLGVVLAELATGHRPQAQQGVAAGSPIERDGHVDRLPEALRRLILHCTDVDPAQRPGDARYVLHQFRQVARQLTA